MGKYSIKRIPGDVLVHTAEKMRALRKKSGYSQAELARRSGVSLGSLKRFESSGQISLSSFLKMLHLLDRLDEFDGLLKPGDDLRDIDKLFSNG